MNKKSILKRASLMLVLVLAIAAAHLVPRFARRFGAGGSQWISRGYVEGVRAGTVKTVPIPVGDVKQLYIHLLTDDASLRGTLRDPQGEAVKELSSPVELLSILSAFPGSPTYQLGVVLQHPEDGLWELELSAESGANYTLDVSAATSTRLLVEMDKPHYTDDDPILVTARLERGGKPVEGATIQGRLQDRKLRERQLDFQEVSPGLYQTQIDPFTDVDRAVIWVTATSGTIQRFSDELPVEIDLKSAQIVSIASERWVDGDGDGKAESLDIDVMVDVQRTGNYVLKGWLRNRNGPELIDMDVYQTGVSTNSAGERTQLAAGRQLITLSFNGSAIRKVGIHGPYHINLRLRDVDQYGETVDEQDGYLTRSYRADHFR
jgi:hypothetical protein